ncbi:MAG: DMT family transporter [Cyanobacteriota bacterium]|nr:DMT family transporter [Cyanobacteriota bacterium]
MTGLLAPATPDPANGAVAALLAALCWTVATLLWRRLPTAWTARQLNLQKTLLAFVLQLPLLALVRWPPGQGQALLLLALSGVVGIAWGDSLFFSALRRLGTRRSLTLTAGGPALTALVGLVTLGEHPRGTQWLGIGLITLSVVLVARQRPTEPHGERPAAAGVPWAGLALALAAMTCGSAGALLARVALRSGAVPALLAATVRLGAATVVLMPIMEERGGGWASGHAPQRGWPTIVGATLLGTSLGILLQQLALTGLPGGLAVALLSTSPVMALPFARLEGDRPGTLGLLAAVAATAGVSLVAGLALPLAG